MQDCYRRVLQGSNQQNKNFNRKRVRVVCYLEQKRRTPIEIFKTIQCKLSKPTDAKQRKNKIIDIFAAMRLFVGWRRRRRRRSLTLVESKTTVLQHRHHPHSFPSAYEKTDKKIWETKHYKYVLDKSKHEVLEKKK